MNSSPTRKADALIAFGANQGDRESAYRKSIQLLESHEKILEIQNSDPLETRAVLGTDTDSREGHSKDKSNAYLNAAIRVLTTFSVRELHAELIDIEQQLGRERTERWGPRTIDLDLLLFSDQKIRSSKLSVPHPRMSFRQFVLRPALEIAADMVHPDSGMNIAQLVDHLEKVGCLVCLVTDNRKFAESIINLPTQIEIVEQVDQFMRLCSDAKLVVSCFDHSSANQDAKSESLERFATNFAGPMLQIDPRMGIEFARTELSAAIEAMDFGAQIRI